jgi:hypothetical protein
MSKNQNEKTRTVFSFDKDKGVNFLRHAKNTNYGNSFSEFATVQQ